MTVAGFAHPVLMLETWLKEAQELLPPTGVADIRRKSQRSVGRDRQEYAQPNPPAAATNPATIATQKDLSPPPVQ